MANRLSRIPATAEKYAGTVDDEGRWTGKLNFDEAALTEPLCWRKPRRVFVCSMSDLFHESVPFEWIDRVFAVMGCCHQCQFQVLTKRPQRMAEFIGRDKYSSAGRHGAVLGSAHFELPNKYGESAAFDWPLPNVWLGTSCEDQRRADERIPILAMIPAAVRFVSFEPLLSAIDIMPLVGTIRERKIPGGVHVPPKFSWSIIGGESGPGARPCNVEWIRSLKDQCQAAGIATWVKQLGARPIAGSGEYVPNYGTCKYDLGPHGTREILDRAGADPDEWPEDLRVQEWPR